MATCYVDDCLRPSARAGLCETHRKRKQRGREEVEHMSPRERVVDAANDIASAETDRQFEAAMRRIVRAAAAMPEVRRRALECLRALGWRPPVA